MRVAGPPMGRGTAWHRARRGTAQHPSCRGWLGLPAVARVAGLWVAGGGSGCRCCRGWLELPAFVFKVPPRETPIKPVLSGFKTERFQDRFDTFDSFSLAEAPVCKTFFPSLWSWRIF